MPKAYNLKDAYNNFNSFPLKNDEEFREFYVERPKSAKSPVNDIKVSLEISNKPEKYLFLGFRGSGKSTELNRLINSLDKNMFFIVRIYISTLDMSDFDFRDFFTSIALTTLEEAHESGIRINKDIENDIQSFMMDITKITEKEKNTLAGGGISFSKILLLKISREHKTREIIRKKLEMRISNLIDRINWLIQEIESRTHKKVIFVIDDLDKLPRVQQAEDFFFKNTNLLLQPQSYIIYTFPIPLTFNPYFENVRHAFDNNVVLPQIPVRNRDGEIIKENFNFYRELTNKRMDLSLIEEKALELAIESSGKLAEFFNIMHVAIIKAINSSKTRITVQEVEEATNELRIVYDRTLTEQHKRRLIEIHKTKEARDKTSNDKIIRELLFSLTAVEYQDANGRWCDVNPLLYPLLEQWEKQT